MLRRESIELLIHVASVLVSAGVLGQNEFEEYKEMFEEKPKECDFPNLLTVQEVARVLQVHRKTVYDFIYEHKLVRKKLGRRSVRITGESLRQFLKNAEQ